MISNLDVWELKLLLLFFECLGAGLIGYIIGRYSNDKN